MQGFVLGRLEQCDSGRLYYLQKMGVKSAEQGRGIGSELLDHLLNELKTRDVERVYLSTMRERPAASFYSATGFHADESAHLQYRQLHHLARFHPANEEPRRPVVDRSFSITPGGERAPSPRTLRQ